MSHEEQTIAGGRASVQVSALPLRSPVRIPRQASIRDAASAMRAERISSLVVDTYPPSFVTERDLVRAIADGRPLTEPVTDIATRSPIWVPPTVTVGHAAAVMVGLGVRHLLVFDITGEVTGVLSIRDAFEALLASLEPDGWMDAFGEVSEDAAWS